MGASPAPTAEREATAKSLVRQPSPSKAAGISLTTSRTLIAMRLRVWPVAEAENVLPESVRIAVGVEGRAAEAAEVVGAGVDRAAADVVAMAVAMVDRGTRKIAH